MKKLITYCTCFIFCIMFMTGCTRNEIKKLTDADVKTYTKQMSDNPLSGDIFLNGYKLSLPISVKQLVDSGFRFNDFDEKSQKIEDGYYVEGILMDDGYKDESTRIHVTIYNTSGSTVKLDDAKIGAISFNPSIKDYKNTVVLPKGITFKSKYDDIVKAYGKPGAEDKQKVFVQYYKNGEGKYGQELKVQFDNATKNIKKIELKNIPEN